MEHGALAGSVAAFALGQKGTVWHHLSHSRLASRLKRLARYAHPRSIVHDILHDIVRFTIVRASVEWILSDISRGKMLRSNSY